ncbi:phytanoyl-CoA dioxygenase family protein [Kitasatospora cystarginea]|uniref:phytanoyl-CoA dioxygenase family protein n=1 Tax=Kitasatospora cystarginea TaxID=58350 RepID=UPI0031D5F848
MTSHFRDQGYAVLPDILSAQQVSDWRAAVADYVAQTPPPAGHTGPYFLWPHFDTPRHRLLKLYGNSGVGGVIRSFIHHELLLDEPEFAQLALTIPPHPHRPGAPHIDGLTPTEDDGRPGTFTVLAGVVLTDQQQVDRGNLWVWPGTHLRTGRWLREHGADALRTAIPYPPVELGEPIQVTAPAGSLVLVHYLLAHNIGGHFGTATDERRETVYFRLHAAGHRLRWREVVTSPLVEFASP